MLLVPTSYQAIRGGLLALILLCSFGRRKLYMNKTIWIFWCLNFFVCVVAFIIGIIKGNPGAFRVTTVALVWPVLYLYFMMNIHSLDVIRQLFKVIVYGGIITGLLNALLLLNKAYLGIGALSAVAEMLGYKYGIYDGYMEFFSPTQSFFPYFLFFYVSLLCVPRKDIQINRKHLLFGSVLMAILILLSGRRAMWVVVCLLPFILVGVLRYTNMGKSGLLLRFVFFITVFVLIVGYVILSYSSIDIISAQVSSIFEFYEDASNYERTLQFRSLKNDFFSSPFLGNGLGHASAYVRTPEAPWEYELEYNYEWAVYGILGSLVQYITYGWILVKGLKIVKGNYRFAEYLIPPIVAFAAMGIINATNPYLAKFDFLWTFFLPIIILNVVLCLPASNANE